MNYKINPKYSKKILRGALVHVVDQENHIELKEDVKTTDVISAKTNLGVFSGCEYTDTIGNRITSANWPADQTLSDVTANIAWNNSIFYTSEDA